VKRLDAILARGGRKCLVAYVCVGDPSVDESIGLARACLDAGADIVELGVPFSDPTADGPAIARASQRAIAAGGGVAAGLRAAREVRAAHGDAGVVLFGYYNPLLVRGEERVTREAAQAGVDALLVVDLPIDESRSLRDVARAAGVGVVPLLAPTSSAPRVAAVKATAAAGGVPFVYYVGVAGVTGSGALDAREAGTRAAKLRAEVGVPVVVGFGIDSEEKARAVAEAGADGVVVGTALVRAVEDGKTPAERRGAVERIVRELRRGVDAFS
jgi:tryptophan synthase alpha chain